MKLTAAQISTYFSRIGYTGPTSPSEGLLRDLIWKHVTSIPFEGLAIHFGDKVHVDDVNKIFSKLVDNHRGGWCYEMNGLFYHVLHTLGFEVKLQLASVFENGWLPPSHAILIVKLARKLFLVDVGFGNISLVEPIELVETHKVQAMRNGINYTISELYEDDSFLYTAGFNEKLAPQYLFILAEQSLQLRDLIILNENISTNKVSPFTQNVVIKKTMPQGFMKLINKEYAEYHNTDQGMKIIKHTVTSMDEYLTLIQSKFGIILSKTIEFKLVLTENPVIRFSDEQIENPMGRSGTVPI